MLPQLLYYDLGPRVTAFSTTRHGGCSTGAYASMNVNAFCGDEPERVTENRQLLCKELGLSGMESLFIPHQVHGDFVMKIDRDFLNLPKDSRSELLEGVDALMTDQAGICIGVSTADCIPVLIYDPDHHCAAAVHAGWRGTVQRIVQEAADMMFVFYHSDYRQMQAVIGPGISLRNFEVGQEVYDQFGEAGFPMEQIAALMPVGSPAACDEQSVGPQQKWHIDLPRCNRLQLQDCGVPAANIHDCGICTYDHTADFFSARRLGISSGRIYTGIVLR